MKTNKWDIPGTVLEVCDSNRSYTVDGVDGGTYLRNRRYLRSRMDENKGKQRTAEEVDWMSAEGGSNPFICQAEGAEAAGNGAAAAPAAATVVAAPVAIQTAPRRSERLSREKLAKQSTEGDNQERVDTFATKVSGKLCFRTTSTRCANLTPPARQSRTMDHRV